jgi:hypothetical protein
VRNFQFLNTIGNIHTPQMGVDSRDYPEWQFGSDAASFNDMANLVAKKALDIEELMDEARVRVVSRVETYTDHGIHDALRFDTARETFVRLKGDYVACPYCLLRENLVTPIRQGQLVRVRNACWEVIKWRTMDEVVADEAVAVGAAREVILDVHNERVRRAHVHERSLAIRIFRANARPVVRHQGFWDRGRQAADQSDLHYAVALGCAGGTRDHPKPYSTCPWEPHAMPQTTNRGASGTSSRQASLKQWRRS